MTDKKITVTKEQIEADNEIKRWMRENINRIIEEIVNQYREEEEND